jgi:hypothetical protein
LTCSQTFSHFLRHVNGLPQRSQTLDGRFAFLIPLGIHAAVSQRGRLFGKAPVFEKTFEVFCLRDLDEGIILCDLNRCDDF